MTTSFREENSPKPKKLRLIPSHACYGRIVRAFARTPRHAEIHTTHAIIIDQQTHAAREQTRLLRHLRRHRDGTRRADWNGDGQTARDRTRSVLRRADQTDRVIRAIDDLQRRFLDYACIGGADIDQTRIQRNAFAAKMSQRRIGGAVHRMSRDGQQGQYEERPA
jgi:hypothetical protein